MDSKRINALIYNTSEVSGIASPPLSKKKKNTSSTAAKQLLEINELIKMDWIEVSYTTRSAVDKVGNGANITDESHIRDDIAC